MRKLRKVSAAPRGLSKEARELWQRTVALWRIDDPTALLCLRNACYALDRLRQAEQQVKREGLTIKDRWGQHKQHPAALSMRDEGKTLRENLKMLQLDLESLNPSQEGD